MDERRGFLDRILSWLVPAGIAEQQRARLFVVAFLCGPMVGYVAAALLGQALPTLSAAFWVFVAMNTGFLVFPFALRITRSYPLVSIG